MSRKDRFACFIPVKPYVKRFLLTNFNEPDYNWQELVNLSSDKELNEAFRRRLQKKEFRYDHKYACLKKYSEQIAIEISKDDFYRHGWSLPMTDVVGFGILVEKKIRMALFTYVDVRVSFGAEISTAIREFTKKFGFTEYDWKYDSIRKAYYRHACMDVFKGVPQLHELVDSIVLGALSKNGTISSQGMVVYTGM